MKLGPKEFTCNVHNSMLVGDLKQQLIDGGKVGFSMNESQFIVTADDNHGVATDIPLLEESLPLHMYWVGDNTTIRIVGEKVMIDLVGPGGQHWWKAFPRTMTIKQLKDERSFRGDFFKNISRQVSVWVFLQKGKTYKKLQDKATVGSVLTDNDVVHLVDDRYYPDDQMIPVFYGGKRIGRVGYSHNETVLTVKLRLQEQMGFPVAGLDFKSDGKSVANVTDQNNT